MMITVVEVFAGAIGGNLLTATNRSEERAKDGLIRSDRRDPHNRKRPPANEARQDLGLLKKSHA